MKTKNRGFTLIELLIVVTIIAILALIGLNAFIGAQAKGRDSKRKSDLSQISKALEQYYNDFGNYPSSSSGGAESITFLFSGCGTGGVDECHGGQPFEANGVVYMAELPRDPRNGRYYYESGTANGSYQLYARLENANDPAVVTVLGSPANYGVDCQSGDCNFGISSSNTTPEEGKIIAED